MYYIYIYMRLRVRAREKAFVFVVQMSSFVDIFRTFSIRRSLYLSSRRCRFLLFAFVSGVVVVTINLISSSRGFRALRGVSILSINSLDFIVDVFSERRLRIRFQIFLQLGDGRRADDARTDEIAVSNETQG